MPVEKIQKLKAHAVDADASQFVGHSLCVFVRWQQGGAFGPSGVVDSPAPEGLPVWQEQVTVMRDDEPVFSRGSVQ